MEELKAKARAEGLWNLFLPHHRGAVAVSPISSTRHCAEITGRSPRLAPEVFNCAAPDTGNMEVLADVRYRGAEEPLADAVAGR